MDDGSSIDILPCIDNLHLSQKNTSSPTTAP